mmetsp:Transcript_5858/g.12057  ORF Transcript_5858/g.12057 Transcript_5858/m.12057 type:complete len:111 (-) Transcript_5858:1610-1942(-)
MILSAAFFVLNSLNCMVAEEVAGKEDTDYTEEVDQEEVVDDIAEVDQMVEEVFHTPEAEGADCMLPKVEEVVGSKLGAAEAVSVELVDVLYPIERPSRLMQRELLLWAVV